LADTDHPGSGLVAAEAAALPHGSAQQGSPSARQALPAGCECILLDVETQWDLFRRGGSCYRWPHSPKAATNIRALFQWAGQNRIPVISSVLRVRRGELGPLADVPHCVEGSQGERKLARTVLWERTNFGLRNSADLPANVFHRYHQVIFEKRHTDLFAHAGAERLITELSSCTFVVCGAGVAKGIAQAAIGLRARGFPVILVRDATLVLREELAEMAFLRMHAKDVTFLRTAEIVVSGPAVLGAAASGENAYGEPGLPMPCELRPLVESGIDGISE